MVVLIWVDAVSAPSWFFGFESASGVLDTNEPFPCLERVVGHAPRPCFSHKLCPPSFQCAITAQENAISPMSIQAIKTAKAFGNRFGAAVHLAHVHQFCYQAGFTADTAGNGIRFQITGGSFDG
jgi:hypothetical protein